MLAAAVRLELSIGPPRSGVSGGVFARFGARKRSVVPDEVGIDSSVFFFRSYAWFRNSGVWRG